MKHAPLLTIATVSLSFSAWVGAVSVSASANVELVDPLVITETSSLTFGNITNLNGSCVMQDDGVLLASGGQTCSGSQVPAQFNISGNDGSLVDIVVQANHTEPGLTFIPKLVGSESKSLTGGSTSVQVVGTLNISNASDGNYYIPYIVTVNYQ